jgi:carbon monoxide dehydrogenase subunit G
VKIDGNHRFALPREQVWKALLDPQVLADTLPGLKRLDIIDSEHYNITIEVGVGVIKGVYDGTFQLKVIDPGERCEIRGAARSPQGSVDAVAEMRIADAPGGGAIMNYTAETTVTGLLAGVGQRMIGAVARRLTDQFLTSVEQAVLAGDSTQPNSDAKDISRVAEITAATPGPSISKTASGSLVPGTVRARASSSGPLWLGWGIAIGIIIGILLERLH